MFPLIIITRIGDELRNHYFFIDFSKKIDNIEYLNVFCEFYHKYDRFAGADNLTVLPRPQIPHFLNGNEMISPSRLFERFQWTDARGLVSVQALAALAVSLGQHANDDVAKGVMSQFLHKMSHQVLDGQNTTILPQFSELINLMDELRALFVGGAETAVKQNKEMLEKANQIMNDYNYAFDLSEAERIQMEMDKKLSSGEKIEIPPDYVPPPLATTDEIKEATTKKNKDFIKISLVVGNQEIKAENDIADQKTKKIIKDRVNPTPGLFANDTFDANKELNTNVQKIQAIPMY